jgi:hypothetical protein
MVLLQVPPGGAELLVIALLFVILLSPLALLVGLVYLLRQRRRQVSDLETRVDDLERELDERD